MAKKLDSEALKKNQFWIGLGAFVLIWLIAVLVVLFSGDPAPKQKWDEAKKKVDSAKNSRPKTPAYQEPWKAYGKKFSDHKDKIWLEAWEQQKGMYEWPRGMAVVPQFPDDSWGQDELNNRSKFRDLYKTQFTNLDRVVAPVELAGGLDAIVPMQKWSDDRAPSREEIWLAQEEFWVRRELLYVVAEALRAVAFFQVVKLDDKDKLPEGIVARQKFRNPNWEVDLRFEKAKDGNQVVVSPTSTIKNVNVNERTQALANPRNKGGLLFRLWQGSAQRLIAVTGEPVPFGKEAPIKLGKDEADVAPVNPRKSFGLEQVLEWELSPVRKIESIQLAHHSHRTVTSGLKIREDLKKLDPDPSETAEKDGQPATGSQPGSSQTGGGPGGSSPPGGMGGMSPPGGMTGMMPPGGGMSGGMTGATTGELTPHNKINRSRYMHVKDQARHLPIAMRLVVDQAHIHDVMAAIANSRLRIQVTQATMHHVRTVQRASKDGKGGKDGTPVPPGGGMYMPGGGDGFMGPPGAGSGYRPGMMIPPGTGTMPGSGVPPKDGGRGDRPDKVGESTQIAHDTARLVELSVYGIATLYERPREKKKEDQPGTTPDKK